MRLFRSMGVALVLMVLGGGVYGEHGEWPAPEPGWWQEMTPEQMEAVLAEHEVNARSELGVTPLMLAAGFNENPAVIEVLIAAGAEVDAEDSDGRTALTFAEEYNRNPDVAELLRQALPAPPGLQVGVDIQERIEEELVRFPLEDREHVVLFSQNGEYRPVANDRVMLLAEPFVLHVIGRTDPTDYLLMNFSTGSTALDLVRDGRSLAEEFPADQHWGLYPGAGATGMAEYPFNERRAIITDPVGSHAFYWPREQDDPHRFDPDGLEDFNGVFVGRRTVELIDDTPIAQLSGEALYVIEFGSPDPVTDSHLPVRAYTIAFVDELAEP